MPRKREVAQPQCDILPVFHRGGLERSRIFMIGWCCSGPPSFAHAMAMKHCHDEASSPSRMSVLQFVIDSNMESIPVLRAWSVMLVGYVGKVQQDRRTGARSPEGITRSRESAGKNQLRYDPSGSRLDSHLLLPRSAVVQWYDHGLVSPAIRGIVSWIGYL